MEKLRQGPMLHLGVKGYDDDDDDDESTGSDVCITFYNQTRRTWRLSQTLRYEGLPATSIVQC